MLASHLYLVISSRCNKLHVITKLLKYCFIIFSPCPFPPHYYYTKELLVNLHPVVLEVLYETKYLKKMHFKVPDVVLDLCADEEQIKRHQMK